MLEELIQLFVTAADLLADHGRATSGETASWWRIVRHLLSEMAYSNSLYCNIHLAAELENTLIRGLLLASPTTTRGTEQFPEGKTPQHLLKARQFILDTAKEDVNLEQIEQVAGVSASSFPTRASSSISG